jgi:hypothetical protein
MKPSIKINSTRINLLSTGNEPMTGAQGSYLKTLSDEAGETFDENLTKAEASKRTDELQPKTGRGLKIKRHDLIAILFLR